MRIPVAFLLADKERTQNRLIQLCGCLPTRRVYPCKYGDQTMLGYICKHLQDKHSYRGKQPIESNSSSTWRMIWNIESHTFTFVQMQAHQHLE